MCNGLIAFVFSFALCFRSTNDGAVRNLDQFRFYV
jgi:hypothetical protein